MASQKRILSALLCALLVLSATACGSSTDTNVDETGTAETTATTETSEA